MKFKILFVLMIIPVFSMAQESTTTKLGVDVIPYGGIGQGFILEYREEGILTGDLEAFLSFKFYLKSKEKDYEIYRRSRFGINTNVGINRLQVANGIIPTYISTGLGLSLNSQYSDFYYNFISYINLFEKGPRTLFGIEYVYSHSDIPFFFRTFLKTEEVKGVILLGGVQIPLSKFFSKEKL